MNREQKRERESQSACQSERIPAVITIIINFGLDHINVKSVFLLLSLYISLSLPLPLPLSLKLFSYLSLSLSLSISLSLYLSLFLSLSVSLSLSLYITLFLFSFLPPSTLHLSQFSLSQFVSAPTSSTLNHHLESLP